MGPRLEVCSAHWQAVTKIIVLIYLERILYKLMAILSSDMHEMGKKGFGGYEGLNPDLPQ